MNAGSIYTQKLMLGFNLVLFIVVVLVRVLSFIHVVVSVSTDCKWNNPMRI